MLNDTPQDHLISLQKAVQKLEKLSLPAPAASILEDANRHLQKLASLELPGIEQIHLFALYRVSQVLGTSLDLDEVLNQVMDAVIDLTGAERGFLMLVDPDSGETKLRAARNIEHETLERKDMEVSRTVIKSVLSNGEGILTTDAQKDSRFSGQTSVVFFGLRSVLCAPLRARGKVIGVIYVDNRAQSGVFIRDDLDLLNAFAIQAAIAIENARLYTQTDQALAARVAELETLTQLDRELNAQLDFWHVIEITRRWALAETQAEQCWIVLKDDEDALQMVDGAQEEMHAVFEEHLGSMIRETLDLREWREYPQTSEQPACLIAPILCAERGIGALVVARSHPFRSSAGKFLERLAGRAAAAIENARLYQAVQQANQAKTKFVSVVTHELRIPMTSIRGYSDLLKSGAAGPLNDQQVNFIGVIRNNVDRMSALVSDLSDISHIEAGRLKLNLSSLKLEDVTKESITSLTPRLQEKQQTLDINLDVDLPQVHADHNRLIQVFNNLISNAWKYTPTQGKIMVRARAEGAYVRVEISDTGIGISPQDQQQLFSQFFRSEDPSVREQQGWGLGLNVAKRLVNLMGGEIGARSTLGQGSTFWFTLPAIAALQD
jgi:signal transduction histidine kinase